MKKYEVRLITPEHVEQELVGLEFDRSYIPKALEKYDHYLFKIKNLRTPAANVLKQTALSKGADLAVSTHTVTCQKPYTDAILTATGKQTRLIIESLKEQYFGLKDVAQELETLLTTLKTSPPPLLVRNTLFEWGKKTYLMGIINVTPDSFSDGGLHSDPEQALCSIAEMIRHGVDIIDIGGESTRPGAKAVDPKIQLERLLPVITQARKEFPSIVISVDTRSSEVARETLSVGADMINDVSGLTADQEMAKVIATFDAPVILMHSSGPPETMQQNPTYTDVMDEIYTHLITQVEYALEAGIKREKIIIDPGIGFGKTMEHNLTLIQRAKEFKSLGYPVLYGASRKRFVGHLLESDSMGRDVGSAVIHALLAAQGVDILRVHNTEIHSQVVKVVDAIRTV